MADLDLDGFEDIVSVHESDSNYDSTVPGETPEAMGHVRIAFGSDDPDKWVNITLGEGRMRQRPRMLRLVMLMEMDSQISWLLLNYHT